MSRLCNHARVAGPHEVLAGLLGQRSAGGMVLQTVGLVSMLVVVLDDPSRDLTRPVLLARPLREGRAAHHRHRRAGAVVHQVGCGRHAGAAMVGVQRVVVAVAQLTAVAG